MSKQGIAQEAQTGFAEASAYDTYRPSYPEEAVSKLVEELKIAGKDDAVVADMAAGTGKFTELLARRPEKFKILAIEPHDGMRAELDKKRLAGVEVIKGTAEDLSALADDSLDAMIVAQAFHWFATMDVLKVFYRVIKPTGTLGMIWNIEEYNAPKSWETSSSWEAKVRDLTWTRDDNRPRYRHEKWRQVFDEQLKGDPMSLLSLADPLFSMPLGENSIPFETWLEKEDIFKRYMTISHNAILEGEEREKTRKIFFDAIDADDVKTDEKGRVAVHGHTLFMWTTRIPGEPLKSGG